MAAQAEAAEESVRLADAAKQEKIDEMAAKLDANTHTLKSLLELYCDDQKRLGRTSHKDARSIFKLHIFEQWPEIAGMPANEVTEEQIADMMRHLHEAGHKRTANKLRSYVAAAYARGKSARSAATVPIAFKLFKIEHNPAKDTLPDVGANKADKDPLSVTELGSYWRGIRRLEGSKGAVLRLHLLTGAQRIEQLMNLKTSNISAKSILIYDGKGRPGQEPRPHSVPLIPAAVKSLTACSPKGQFALSTDGGKTHVSASTFSEWAKESAAGIAGFKAKRIRSGIETLLSGAKIGKDDRGHLQSHGITGVQDRHYDGHDYMEEKRKALAVLYKLLEAPHVKK
jgi:integrase